MNFFKKLGRRIKRDVTGRSITSSVKSAEKTIKGISGKGDSSGNQQSQAPQMADEARRRAAGAGTVGFTGNAQTPS